jgi:hypothetical protein
MSLNPDDMSYWRLQGYCQPFPSYDNPADATWTPSVSAYCYPQNCGSAPANSFLHIKDSNGVLVPFTTLKALGENGASSASTIACTSDRSLDGLGLVTSVERACMPDYTWSAPLPKCFVTIDPTVRASAHDDKSPVLATITSTWTEEAVTDVRFLLTCAPGYAAHANAITNLPADASAVHDTFRSACVPIPLIPSSAFSATAIDSYSFTAVWPPPPFTSMPVTAPGVTWHYELRFDLVWPNPAAVSIEDSELSGVTRDGTIISVSGNLTNTQTIVVTDSRRFLAQVQASFAIRLVNSNKETGTWQKWSGSVQLPCVCTSMLTADIKANPLAIVPFAQLSLRQLFLPEQNAVELNVLNVSPCIGSVALRALAGGPAVPAQTLVLTSPSECPAPNGIGRGQNIPFNLGSAFLPRVTYEATPILRTISRSSSVVYRSAPAAPSSRRLLTQAASATIVTLAMRFFFALSGRVHTAVTEFSPDPVGMFNATVRIEVKQGGQSLQANSTQTDAHGEYQYEVVLTEAASQDLSALVLSVRVDDNDADGVPHSFKYSGNTSEFMDAQVGRKFAASYRVLNFFDASHIVLSGRVTSEPRRKEWHDFSGCGVELSIIDVYRFSDVQPNNATGLYEVKPGAKPVRSSLPTDTTGKWEVTAPKAFAVVVIPRNYTFNSSAPPHKFIGPADSISYLHDGVNNTRATELNFFDVTERTVRLRISSGEAQPCRFHIGTAMPTFVHEGCGGRKVTMRQGFSDQFQEYKGAPPVQLVVKGWDPIYRGQFRPRDRTTDGKKIDGAQVTAFGQSVHDWMDKQPTARVDLHHQAADQHEFVFIAPTQVRMRMSSSAVPACETVIPQQLYTKEDAEVKSGNKTERDVKRPFHGQVAKPETGKVVVWNPEYIVVSSTAKQSAGLEVTFELFEDYLDNTCTQVNGSVYVHDFSYEAVREHKLAPDLPCHAPCHLPTAWVEGKTVATYTLRPNRVEWRDDIVWDMLPSEGQQYPAPPRSFPLYYAVSNQVLAPLRTHVVVTGDADLFGESSWNGSTSKNWMTIPFPSIPLFILHDPPGSMSTTSLELEDRIQLQQVTAWAYMGGVESDFILGPFANARVTVGTGFAKDVITHESRIGEYTKIVNIDGPSRSNTLSRGYTYSQAVRTSDDRGLVDGDGSLALLHTGLIRLREFYKVDKVADKCNVLPSAPFLEWMSDPATANSFAWVSKWQVRNVTMVQIQREMQLNAIILEAAEKASGANTKECPESEPSPASAIDLCGLRQKAKHLAAAYEGWRFVLDEFSASILRAEKSPFDPRTSHVTLAPKAVFRPVTDLTDSSMPSAPQGDNVLVKIRSLPRTPEAVWGDTLSAGRKKKKRFDFEPQTQLEGFVQGGETGADEAQRPWDPMAKNGLPWHAWGKETPQAPEMFEISFDGSGTSRAYQMQIISNTEGTKKTTGEFNVQSGPKVRLQVPFEFNLQTPPPGGHTLTPVLCCVSVVYVDVCFSADRRNSNIPRLWEYFLNFSSATPVAGRVRLVWSALRSKCSVSLSLSVTPTSEMLSTCKCWSTPSTTRRSSNRRGSIPLPVRTAYAAAGIHAYTPRLWAADACSAQ